MTESNTLSTKGRPVFGRDMLQLAEKEIQLFHPRQTLYNISPLLYDAFAQLDNVPSSWTGLESIQHWVDAYATTISDSMPQQHVGLAIRNIAARIQAYLWDMAPEENPFTHCVLVRMQTDKLLGPFTCMDSVNDLRSCIYTSQGIPQDQQVLVFAGKRLETDEPLSSWVNTKHTPIIRLVLNLRGMISTFDTTHHNSSPLVQCLMSDPSGDFDHPLSEDIQQCLREKLEEENGDISMKPQFWRNNEILSADQLQFLSDFVDHVWERHKSDTTQKDMRIAIRPVYFLRLLMKIGSSSDDAQRCLKGLKEVQSGQQEGNTNGARLAFRRTEGPTNACINFHCDGGYATRTVQITLNDDSEYDGGRLVFYYDGRLHTPLRPQGAMTCHNRAILHAVTPLVRGVRKSLFVVDKTNGLGEAGKRQIYEVKPVDIDTFFSGCEIEQQNSDCANNDGLADRANTENEKICAVCWESERSYALIPCGHLCLCGQCSINYKHIGYKSCPICRKGVQKVQRIYI